MSPRDTDERVIEARTMESGLGPVDVPPSPEAQILAAMEKADEATCMRKSDLWLFVYDAFHAGANWRARQ